MSDSVRLEVSDGVGTIRLDRPPANAIDPEVSGGIAAATSEAAERDDVRAVVVWGGERIFAAGADIKVMAALNPESVRPVVSSLGDALAELEAVAMITISAINGYALGGGLELALATDFRFAAEDSRLGQPEIKIGVFPGAGGTQRLPRLVGPALARDLVYSGRQIGADVALHAGLVDRVLPAAEVYPAAVEAARAYANGPVEALAAAKASLHAAEMDPRHGLEIERDAFCGLFGSADQREGMHAFLEKREPRFGARS
ncbi:MAG: enoyl-CoA hydratase/isomerase family protein [Actinomycetota bacterium]